MSHSGSVNYVHTHAGVLELATGEYLPHGVASGHSRRHPHGFVGNERVHGLHKAVRLGLVREGD